MINSVKQRTQELVTYLREKLQSFKKSIVQLREATIRFLETVRHNELFRNPKKAKILIATFIVAFLVLLAVKARADQDLTFEVGSAILRGPTPTLGFTVTCRECGPVGTDYEYGFELIGESTYHGSNPNVIQVRGALVDSWWNVELGLGFFYQNVETEYVCQQGFHLLLRYRFTERLSLQARHSSTAGSCQPNTGRDLLTLGWRF